MSDSVGVSAGAVGRLQAAHGWRRRGLALVLGALAGLAFPPLFIFPLLILGLTALLLLIDTGAPPSPASPRAGGGASAISSSPSIGWRNRC
jgi:Apolipoprotein N-acyltransferase